MGAKTIKMKYVLQAACGCHIGNIRRNNEDNFYFDKIILSEENDGLKEILFKKFDILENHAIFGVFDGMGGEADGQTASFIAASILKQTDQEYIYVHEKTDKKLRKIISLMNEQVCEKSKELFNQMGCTAAILSFKDDTVDICNVGDSRIYRLRNGVLSQLSEDHTDKEILAKQGIKNRKPRLTQCIGIPCDEMILEPYLGVEKFRNKDCYLICSDGLTDMVSTDEICRILQTTKCVKQCTEELIYKALCSGGRDNITAIVIRVGDNCDITENSFEESNKQIEFSESCLSENYNFSEVSVKLEKSNDLENTFIEEKQDNSVLKKWVIFFLMIILLITSVRLATKLISPTVGNTETLTENDVNTDEVQNEKQLQNEEEVGVTLIVPEEFISEEYFEETEKLQGFEF